MNSHQTTEAEAVIVKNPERLEELFKPIWERVRQATSLIQTLRDEKSELERQLSALDSDARSKLASLERELGAVRTDLAAREQELKRARAEHAQLIASGGRQTFTTEEREILKDRIRELIAKINSYL